ncbi:tRNA 2-thiouridine(34) synthase MnmA [Patescibacteria group bacterium]|nr:tRNA 2-thiouridine(34) synthase MnmA [Patescibacteria group bacterium]
MHIKKESNNIDKRIVVGMSGGVDSSIALFLLKKQGWQPIGVSLKYSIWQDKPCRTANIQRGSPRGIANIQRGKQNALRENVCCSAKSFKIAETICNKLDAPYFVFDVSQEFTKIVIDYFIKELKNNRTPNPCVICNRYLKFQKLFEWAKARNIKYVATGHYAQIRKDTKIDQYLLLRAKDKKKDQTYSLCLLPQKWLKQIIFPIGKYTKQEVYKIAEEQGFKDIIQQKQSQDFCFVSGKSMQCFLKQEIGLKKGPIYDMEKNILGQHQGLHFYTIGQRKGICLPSGPYFVAGINSAENSLIVTKNKRKLYQTEMLLNSCHFISDKFLKKSINIQSKIRYNQQLAKATLYPISKNKIKLAFQKSQRAITAGQFAVFYLNNVCLGAGTISCNV